MATQTQRQPRYIGNFCNIANPYMFGDPSDTSQYLEAASQTYDVGDLIYLVSGAVTICGQSGNILNTQVAGIAQKKATGVTGAATYFQGIRSSDLFEMNVYHTTAASAISALANLGVPYGIKLISGKWVIDIENTAESATLKNGHVIITGFVDPIGDIYGKVKAHFIPLTMETDGGSFQRLLQLLG